MFNKRNGLFLGCLVLLTLAYASRSTWYRRDVVAGVMIHLLENDGTTTQKGAVQLGDDEDTPALPTYANADRFSVKVPFYNATGAATAKGQVLTSSGSVSALVNTGSPFYANSVALIATTTVIGIADGVYSSGSRGWMTVAGYALALTTGTILPGDVLITTQTTGSPKGYASVTFSTATWANPKSAFAVAVGSGNVAGGLTPVVLR